MLPKMFYDSMLDDVNVKRMDSDIYLKNGKYYVDIDIPGFKRNMKKVMIMKIKNIFVMKEDIRN